MIHYNFQIAIPSVNRADLLLNAWEEYKTTFPDIGKYILDNGKQPALKAIPFKVQQEDNFDVSYSENNLGVAMSWNLLCMAIFREYEYAVILNDDIILQYNQLDFARYLDKQKPMLATHGSGWCAFIMHKSVFDQIGFFDFNFSPAYFEDADYAYRCKLAGIEIVQPEILRTKVANHSSSIKKDPSLNDRFKINEQYYVQKWGGLPKEEKFTTPFNIK